MSNRSSKNMQVLIFNEFCFKLPIHAPEMEVFGELYSRNGEQPHCDPQKTSLCRNTPDGVQISKIGPPVFAQFTLLPSPKFHALQCFPIGQTPKKCPFPWRHLHSYLIHGFLDFIRFSIPNCISTGSAVFAYLKADVPILYNGTPLPPSKLPLLLGDLNLHLIHGSHPSQHSKRHRNRFSRFYRAHGRDGQTDRQTDREIDRYTTQVLSL